MLCVHCGAINLKDTKICTSCGRDIYEFGGTPPGEPVEYTMESPYYYVNDSENASQSSDAFLAMSSPAASSDSRGKFIRSMMLMSLVVMFIILVPLFFLQGNAKKGSSLSDKADTGLPVNDQLGGGITPANEVTSDERPDETQRLEKIKGQLVVPSNGSLIIATDTAKKARTMQIKSALHIYYAENDQFPSSLDELYPNLINKKAEDWLTYTTDGNPPTYFELEFNLANENDADPNKIVKDGAAKYILTSEYR